MTRLRNFTGRDLWLMVNDHPMFVPAEGRACVEHGTEPVSQDELDYLDGIRLNISALVVEVRGLPEPADDALVLVSPGVALAASDLGRDDVLYPDPESREGRWIAGEPASRAVYTRLIRPRVQPDAREDVYNAPSTREHFSEVLALLRGAH